MIHLKSFAGGQGCKGAVFGAHGEVSPNVHELLKLFAKHGAKQFRQLLFKKRMDCEAFLLRIMRRRLSVVALETLAQLRINKMDHILAAKCSTAHREYDKWWYISEVHRLRNAARSASSAGWGDRS